MEPRQFNQKRKQVDEETTAGASGGEPEAEEVFGRRVSRKGGSPAGRKAPADRLIDALIDYVRERATDPSLEPNREEVARGIVRHLWRHPVPTGLLLVSAAWLLVAGDDDGDRRAGVGKWRARRARAADAGADRASVVDEGPEGFVDRLEDEVLQQVEGGYDYTRRRLQEAVHEYPWAAAAVLVGGGILAATLLPHRRHGQQLAVEPEGEPAPPPEALDEDEEE